MKPLRLKLTVTTLLFIGLGCGSAAIGLNSFLEIYNDNQRVRQSILLRDWVSNLDDQPIREEIIKELQNYRSHLFPSNRQNALSDVIQAYSSGNRSLLRKRIHTFELTEKRFVLEMEPLLVSKEKQTFYFGSIFVILCFFGLVWYRAFVLQKILEPIDRLTNRMIDFLNGRYSYRFEVPPSNEVGDLESSFNAMAQRVLQNVEELKALDSAKSDFLNIASHELRTPMTSIKGSLGLLTSGVMGILPKDARQLIEIAESETNRLIRLINDILDMAKIEAGKFPLNYKWNSVNDLLKRTIQGMHGLSETSGIGVEMSEFPEVESLMDRDRIQQVVTNLASNAIKFSPKGGVVTLGCDLLENGSIRISVTDQGRGISPEDQKFLFEKFRQVTGPDNPLVKGTGLGLAIAKALVREHNGVIGVQSVPGKGSTFYFTLPQWRYAGSEAEIETTTNNSNYGAAA